MTTTTIERLQSNACTVLIGSIASFAVFAPLAALFVAPVRAIPAFLIIALCAGGLFLLNRRDANTPQTRMLIGGSMALGPAVMLFVFAGHPWQLDMHMLFFAMLAVTALLCDRKAILAAAGATAVHHLLLNFTLPAFVFPDGANFIRVGVHAVIVVAETGALIWMINKLSAAMSAADQHLHDAQAKAAETERLAKERLDDERRMQEEREEAARQTEIRSAEERDRVMRELSTAFTGVVEAARDGDFSQRITQQFGDENIDRLAAAVNRLLERVEDGVGSAAQVMSAVARADLTQSVQKEFGGLLGSLSRDVNTTVHQLHVMIGEIQGASKQLAETMSEIKIGSDQLSQRAATMSGFLDETNGAMRGLSDTMNSHTQTADTAAVAATNILKEVESGGIAMEEATVAIQKIEESSARVGDILQTIENISFQTSLLSLNASVEAARAGEAGKGFAVVAAEIRSLSENTQAASKDIRDLIERSSADVAEGVDRIGTAKTRIETAVSAVDDITKKVSTIAESCRSQVASLEDVLKSFGELDAMTQQNAALSEETQAATVQATDLAASLDKLCGRFTLEGSAKSNRRAA